MAASQAPLCFKTQYLQYQVPIRGFNYLCFNITTPAYNKTTFEKTILRFLFVFNVT